MERSKHTVRELRILEAIEANPETTQASLATELGVAVGTVNWHIKRLVKKGYIKVSQLQRRRLRYIITPSGVALRSKLAFSYLQNSMALYRQTRNHALAFLEEVQQAGYNCVRLEGEGDLADVVRLTCLEQGAEIVRQGDVPLIQIDGIQLRLEM